MPSEIIYTSPLARSTLRRRFVTRAGLLPEADGDRDGQTTDRDLISHHLVGGGVDHRDIVRPVASIERMYAGVLKRGSISWIGAAAFCRAGIGNLTPADVYFGRGQTILIERERTKRQTIANRCLLHRTQAA
jgi:hypothetical protein